jgi:hypothetical protein
MKLYKRICKNPACGKEFIGTRTQQYCSVSCRVPTYKPKRKYHKLKDCTLDEVVRQAKENGMSYGKYVAMQYQMERKKR